jgi:DNA-binding GntR family transcriptional regulator
VVVISDAQVQPGDLDLGRFRTKKFADEAADVLREMILAGHVRAGERVNEVALAQQLGISRSPIREALSALASEGLVEFTPGRGASVVESSSELVRQLGEVRVALECQAARLVAARIPEAELNDLDHLLEATETVLVTKTDAPYPRQLDFHDQLLVATGNLELQRLGRSVITRLQLARARSGSAPSRARRAAEEHRAIFEAIRGGDVDAAEQAMRSHLRTAIDSAVAAMSGNE